VAVIANALTSGRMHRILLFGLVAVMLTGAMLGPAPVSLAQDNIWQAEYYNNTQLDGEPALIRGDAEINFNWGTASPAPEVDADHFSVRWTRNVSFATGGAYTFSATADDGVRVWVNGQLVIDKWQRQSTTTYMETVYLDAGVHHVQVEYFDATGSAVCVVSWAAEGIASSSSSVEIVVDNQDPGFVWGGAAGSFYQRRVGYGDHLNWTLNRATQYTHWGKWFPHITRAGDYEVYVYIAGRYFGSKSARYQVYHNGQRHEKVLDQNIYHDQWVSLGTYFFSGGANEYVYLSNATGEVNGTRYVGFDAAKFVLRDKGDVSPLTECDVAPVRGFGRIWDNYSPVRAGLGCALEPERAVWTAEQTFTGGYLLWRQDLGVIYALYSNGTWQTFEDTWASTEPEWDPGIVPPAGFYQPRRSFGKVWRDHNAVRDNLGWAGTEERGFFGAVQPFSGGTMIWSNLRGIFVLYSDGTWARYN
jgi:hypothetical protein